MFLYNKDFFQKNTYVYHDQRFYQLIYWSRQLSRFNDVKKVRANFCETIDNRALSTRREKNEVFRGRYFLKILPVSVVTIHSFINIENVESAAESCYFIKLHD